MTSKEIISKLPYTKPFLFVEELTSISEEGITGNYTFKEDEFFYGGHFKNNPVTPGVILTEVMAQIGVVCLGIYSCVGKNLKTSSLSEEVVDSHQRENNIQIALTSSQVDFFLPVFPNEKVTVTSEKVFFRFNKLKCKVKLFNEKGELICRGEISGMFKTPEKAGVS